MKLLTIYEQMQPHPSGCIFWTRAVVKSRTRAYGYVWFEGEMWLVHRLVWSLERGPIPEGMTVDHLCKTPLCQNVEHMRLLTRSEHGRESVGERTKTLVCIRGHRFTPENTYSYGSEGITKRQCRACRPIQARLRKEAADVKTN